MNCPTGISTAARYKMDVILLVMGNKVYSIDQYLAGPDVY